MKSLIKKFLPPIVLELIIKLKTLIKNKINKVDSSTQDLNVYYTEEMSNILDTWGERNAWIEIQHIFQNFDKNSKILDIACGTGKVIQILQQNLSLKNIHGCDISDHLINKGISRGISRDRLKVCDATNLPYNQDEFESCYSIGSLEHFTVEGINKFLQSSRKVTKNYHYHMIPVSKNNKNEGWIKRYQSYHNNSVSWWIDVCKNYFEYVMVLDSSWEDQESIGKWLILKK